jgi:hypothetical protein
MTTDEERWAQAEELLRGAPGRVTAHRVRRRRLVLWLAIAAVTATGTGIATGVLWGGGGDVPRPDPALWQQEVAQLCCTAVGVGLVIAALVRMRRRRQWGSAWRAPAMALSREQRRSLLRQVRGREPADPARLALTRDHARRLTAATDGFPLIMAAIVLFYAGEFVARPSAGRAAWYGSILLLWPIAWLIGIRQRRQAQRFLAAHPAPADDA